MPSLVVVDSGPLMALVDRDDAYHKRIVAFVASHPRLRLITTWAVLNEARALLGSRVAAAAELDLLIWVERGGVALLPRDPAALVRIRALVGKHRDLRFDYADASVAVVAEQTDVSPVLTLDRDFEIYADARGKRLKNVLPLAAVRTRWVCRAKIGFPSSQARHGGIEVTDGPAHRTPTPALPKHGRDGLADR